MESLRPTRGSSILVLAAVAFACEPNPYTITSPGHTTSARPDALRTPLPSANAPPSSGLHVQGNALVDGGKIVRLLGVNHSGTENYCEQGTGIFQGPSDASLVAPMKSWKINTIRVPLNEDCWLGINGVQPSFGGAAYQEAIKAFVHVLRVNGMYVVLDLQFNAPGATLATSLQPMPDADHSPAFWRSLALTFAGDMGVLFDLLNEPNVDGGHATDQSWACWLNGCELSSWNNFQGSARAVGMQELVNVVRSAGARNVILVGGLGSAEFLGNGWLFHKPKDPLNNLAASFHNYGFNSGCNTFSCWQSTIAPIAAQVPVVTGELGENDCGHGYVDAYFAWADPLGISYLGWTWNTWDCASGPSLISDYDGTATGFGQGFKEHLPTQ